MRQIQCVAMAVVMAIALAGCAGTGTTPGTPCEKCEYGYVSVQKDLSGRRVNRLAVCIVDGKTMDCTKNPPECPDCAKAAQNK